MSTPRCPLCSALIGEALDFLRHIQLLLMASFVTSMIWPYTSLWWLMGKPHYLQV